MPSASPEARTRCSGVEHVLTWQSLLALICTSASGCYLGWQLCNDRLAAAGIASTLLGVQPIRSPEARSTGFKGVLKYMCPAHRLSCLASIALWTV